MSLWGKAMCQPLKSLMLVGKLLLGSGGWQDYQPLPTCPLDQRTLHLHVGRETTTPQFHPCPSSHREPSGSLSGRGIFALFTSSHIGFGVVLDPGSELRNRFFPLSTTINWQSHSCLGYGGYVCFPLPIWGGNFSLRICSQLTCFPLFFGMRTGLPLPFWDCVMFPSLHCEMGLWFFPWFCGFRCFPPHFSLLWNQLCFGLVVAYCESFWPQ